MKIKYSILKRLKFSFYNFSWVFILFSFPLSCASNTFEDDIKKLSIFQAAFDQMYLEMGEIQTSATRHETGHFSNIESDKIENLLFRYLVLRRSIWDIINKYRDYNIYSDYPNENMKALLVGYASALTLYKYSGILITKNMGDDQVIDKLNEAYFRSDIPRESFREVYHSLTNLENLDKLDIAREFGATDAVLAGPDTLDEIKEVKNELGIDIISFKKVDFAYRCNIVYV